MKNEKDNAATATATETETTTGKRSPRGSSKQARAVAWFLEAYNFAITNGNKLSSELVTAAGTLASEFKTVSSKPAAVRLAEVQDAITEIYTRAQTDFAVLTSEAARLQELFTQKDRIEKRMERTKAEQAARNKSGDNPA